MSAAMNNITLLDTQPVPAIPIPGPVTLSFTATAWTPTQRVNVSYSIMQTANVTLADSTGLDSVAIPDRATPVTLQTRFRLKQGTTAPQSFEVHAEVFDNKVRQFEVVWIIGVKP